MDTRERLYPQSNRQQKLTLRRRCRSETLPQMGHVTIVGTPIDLDDPNELRRKSSHHQTVFRNRIHSKHHSPSIVLRNQESAKNIFSMRENRRTTAAVQLKTNTKENISVAYNDVDGNKDFCLREFELYKDRAAKTNVDFLNINKHQRIEKDDWESFAADDSYTDTHKRRARARSESEPHEIYLTKTSPVKSDPIERSNVSFLLFHFSHSSFLSHLLIIDNSYNLLYLMLIPKWFANRVPFFIFWSCFWHLFTVITLTVEGKLRIECFSYVRFVYHYKSLAFSLSRYASVCRMKFLNYSRRMRKTQKAFLIASKSQS